MYEIRLEIPKTIERSSALTYFDFVSNAKEIFEGKPLAVFGKPIGKPFV